MKIINLTPHPITLRINNVDTTFPASGVVARVEAYYQISELCIEGGYVYDQVFGDVQNLPDPVEGTFYIVSGMVLTALNKSRKDCIGPKTDKTAIRNDEGHIVAVTDWVR